MKRKKKELHPLTPIDKVVYEVAVTFKSGEVFTYESYGVGHVGIDRDFIKESTIKGAFIQIARDEIRYIVCKPKKELNNE